MIHARRSQERLLHEMASELQALITPQGEPEEPVMEETLEEHRYRGVVIHSVTAQQEHLAKKVKRVYRGRVIEE